MILTCIQGFDPSADVPLLFPFEFKDPFILYHANRRGGSISSAIWGNKFWRCVLKQVAMQLCLDSVEQDLAQLQ